MLGYFDEQQERFFTWCDHVVQAYVEEHGGIFKGWWPRKNSAAGSYELVLEMAAPDKALFKVRIPVPEEYHGLLEREYFIDHPPDKDER